MQYRRLGQSALKLSALSYGSWITFGTTLDDRAARDCLACAYDHGINFFDSAEVYLGGEAERMLGRAIKALGWPRDGYCVSSKALYGAADNHAPGGGPRPTQQGLSRKHMVEACEQALRRFGLDYLDLYLCHRPDPDMSIPEIAWTMHTLVQQGKILYWGTSEWPAADIETLCAFAERHDMVPPQLEQPQYSLFHRERVEHEYRPLVERRGLGLTTCRRWPRACWPAGMTRACRRIRGWRRRASAGSRISSTPTARRRCRPPRACATWPMSWGPRARSWRLRGRCAIRT